MQRLGGDAERGCERRGSDIIKDRYKLSVVKTFLIGRGNVTKIFP
jgi:hypothetical protein